ncbi:MAG: hypothetical protein HY699_19755 [Deltaproteobacteria bacterium]|nr:hypothetical protein [Deltaproteobacteria bacterium]
MHQDQPSRRGLASCRSAQWRALLIAVSLALAEHSEGAGAGERPSTVWGDVLLATPPTHLLPRALETEKALTAAFAPAANGRDRHDARGALLNADSVVLISVITLANDRAESFQVPLTTGHTVRIHVAQIILGGTVIAFSPLSRSVLTSVPLLGARVLRLRERPAFERLHDEAMKAGMEFARLAQARGQAIGARARSASVRRRTFGALQLEAGRKDGVMPGMMVSVVNAAADTGIECTVQAVGADTAELNCPTSPGDDTVGVFLRSVGVGTERYQVSTASITSAKARAVLGDAVAADEAMAAFAAADALAATGLTVLPPGGEEGERLTQQGIRQFAAAHGIADAELQRFSLNFPPAEVQVAVVVDGYNTQIVGGSPIKRIRAHKAWATITDSRGRRAEGVGVERIEEIEGWQDNAPQAADARQAIRKAVACATSRLLGGEAEECR